MPTNGARSSPRQDSPLAVISSGTSFNELDGMQSVCADTTITVASSRTRTSKPRTVSLDEAVFAEDNLAYDSDTITEFPFPSPHKFYQRKVSMPVTLDERFRRNSRTTTVSGSPLSVPKRPSPSRFLHSAFANASPRNLSIPNPPKSPLQKTDTSSVVSYSISDESLEAAKTQFTCELLVTLGSIIYAIFLVVLAGVFYLTDLTKKTNGIHQMFNTILSTVGITWLGFLHFDLQRYKRMVMRELCPDGMPPTALFDVDADRLSTNTEVICNNMGRLGLSKRSASMGSFTNFIPSYRFMRGRHSGSFYLKCGMAAFCFGHIINEGMRFAHQIYFFATNDLACQSYTQIVLYVVRPTFAFYQLFISFKYSNIIINRHKNIAQFGLMHLIGSALSFWIGAIIDDAVDYYYLHHKEMLENVSLVNGTLVESDYDESNNESPASLIQCIQTSIPESLQNSSTAYIMPYMYPFTIEYNLLLAALWYFVWHHIGKHSDSAHPHPFQHKVTQDSDGTEDVSYESNLVIKADCHASNKGLFAGLLILLFSLITMIIFFITIGAGDAHKQLSIYVHHTQEVLLAGLILVMTILAYRQTCRFDISPYKVASHTMDFVLLLIPIPFFLTNNVLALIAEVAFANWFRVFIMLLIIVQVIYQTFFIVDAMHRCSFSRKLRFKKPGREFVTFLILLNITSWIVYTFETKASEKLHNETSFYGENIWMILSHTTLPLMLFYRFHSSVCLADIWKFAYEKAHPD